LFLHDIVSLSDVCEVFYIFINHSDFVVFRRTNRGHTAAEHCTERKQSNDCSECCDDRLERRCRLL